MSTDKNNLKPHKPTPRMRALFREKARSIVSRDRSARRDGLSQNTIGAIERAMAEAYKIGQEALIDAEKSFPDASDIDWTQVPVRSRETLCSMSYNLSERFSAKARIGDQEAEASTHEIEVFDESGRKRWANLVSGERSDHSVANSSVAPLIRLGLIHSPSSNQSRYELTDRGLMLCKEYWRRSDADDPTLPKISLR